MKIFRIVLLLAVTALILTSCKKKDDDENPLPSGPATTTTIHISGVVLDTWGNPLQGVEVVCGTKTATTDANGTYAFLNFTSPIEKCVITFTKANYFTGCRTFVPQTGKYMPIEVTLISYYWANAGTTTFSSSTPYTMYIASTGCEIDFPANNWIVEETGDTYSGDVTVYAAFLDPTDPNYGKYAYGGLMMGKNTANEKVYLEAHTGLVVEIYGTSGEKLNLDPNAKASATVRFQIPAGMTNAPSTIDMWDFDMAGGIAGAGGSAAKSGDKYVGEATHFSYWSCERICSGNPATIKGHVTDGTNAVAGVPVLIGSALVFTDANGDFKHTVPAGIIISVGIKPGFLGTNQTPMQVGPLSNDEVYTIPTDFTIPAISYITGQLVNCSGSAVQGHVIFNSMGQVSSSPTDASGHFNIPITTSTMYGYLIANGNGVSVEQYLNIFSYPYDAGTITLCPPIQTGPNDFSVNGTTTNQFSNKSGYVEMDSDDASSLDSGRVFINCSNSTAPYTSMYVHFKGRKTGSYSITQSKQGARSATIYVSDGTNYYMLMSGTINVTKFGAVGALVEGNFSGTASGGEMVTGHFSVQRGPDQNITF